MVKEFEESVSLFVTNNSDKTIKNLFGGVDGRVKVD